MPHDGKALVTYLEHGVLVGTREMYCCGYSPTSGKSISAYWPHTAMFCPVCGEIWGRVIYNYQFQYLPTPTLSPWVIEIRRCLTHGDGQFLVGLDDHLLSCSPDLLRREYLVLEQTAGLPAQAAVQHPPSPEPKSQRLVSARERFQSPQPLT